MHQSPLIDTWRKPHLSDTTLAFWRILVGFYPSETGELYLARRCQTGGSTYCKSAQRGVGDKRKGLVAFQGVSSLGHSMACVSIFRYVYAGRGELREGE